MVSSLFVSRHPLSLSHSPVRALNLYHEASSISWSTSLLPVGTTQLPASCPLDRVLCTSKVGTRGATPMLIAPPNLPLVAVCQDMDQDPLTNANPSGQWPGSGGGGHGGPLGENPSGPPSALDESQVCVCHAWFWPRFLSPSVVRVV